MIRFLVSLTNFFTSSAGFGKESLPSPLAVLFVEAFLLALCAVTLLALMAVLSDSREATSNAVRKS